MTTHKVLWVVPRSFLPVCDGASRANASLLKSFLSACQLRQIDCKVTLVLFITDLDQADSLRDLYLNEFSIEEVVFCRKNILARGLKRISQVLKSFFTSSPLTASFFDLNDNLNKLVELRDKSFDFVLCDGLHTFCAVRDIFSRSQFIYRSHNVEYDLWNLENTNFLSHFILSSQKKKMKSLEFEILQKAKAIWTISNEDRDKYIEDLSDENQSSDISSKVKFIPMGLDFKQRDLNSSKRDNDRLHFLFLGKLDWHPNQEGLLWFLRSVAPYLNENIEISIVGKGYFPIDDFSELSHVHFLGFVESLDALYEQCDACLIPIFSGSGTRIKVIESLAAGVPLISTSFGIQGSGMDHTHCLISNVAQTWIDTLNSWDRTEGESRALKAQTDLKPLYSGQLLQEALSNLLVE